MRILFLFLVSIFSGTLAIAQYGPPPTPPTSRVKPVNPVLVHFDCLFADNTGSGGSNPINMDCADIAKALFDSDRLIQSAASGSSEIDAYLTERINGSYEQYSLRITDHTGVMVPAEVTFSGEPLRQLVTITTPNKTENLIKAIMGLLQPYHAIKSYSYNPDGNLLLEVTPKVNTSTPAAKKMFPFYVSASGYGLVINQGSSYNIMGMPTVTAGFTQIGPNTQNWLVEYSNSTRYNYVSAEVPVDVPVIDPKTGMVELNSATGQPLTQQVNQNVIASNLSTANGLVVAKSLGKHWSIATFLRYNQDPSSNFKGQYQGHAGVEYELLPFLLTNDNTLTVNYLIGGNHNLYYSPNRNGQLIQNIATHALSIYYVFHLNRLDFTGSVAGTTSVGDFKQWGLGGQVGGRVYLNKSKTLTLDPSVNLGLKNNLVNSPAVASTQYEVLQLMGVGTNSTPSTLTIRLGFSWRIGPNLLRLKDTRWQFTSDEVPDNF